MDSAGLLTLMNTHIVLIGTVLLAAAIPTTAQVEEARLAEPLAAPSSMSVDSSDSGLPFAPRPLDLKVPPTQSGTSIGVFATFPSWSWHRGMPVVGEKPINENAYRRTETRTGWGAGLTLRTAIRRTSHPSLHYRIDLGYQRTSSAFYADSGGKVLLSGPIIIESGTRDSTRFDLDVVALGAMIGGGIYTGPKVEPIPEYDVPGGRLGMHGVALLGGAAISWRAGSRAVRTIFSRPDEPGRPENPQGYPSEYDGRIVILYDGDVPDLKRIGVSVRGGLVVELSLGGIGIATIGALYEHELIPVAGEEWRTGRLAITTAFYLDAFP